jgi:lipoprotein-releasing system ATP-binding protein
MSKVLELKSVCKSFKTGDDTLEILKNVDFYLEKGEVVALVGQSGSGKSTMLHISALLLSHTSGSVRINSIATEDLSDSDKTLLRRKNFGFIYQFHNLLSDFSALENVMIPQLINKKSKMEAMKISKELLCCVGLSHRLSHFPSNLSGGEQQRVAIARAIANSPKIVIADEPTGNLDPGNSETVFRMMMEIVRKFGSSMIIATHNLEIAARADRKVVLENGTITN